MRNFRVIEPGWASSDIVRASTPQAAANRYVDMRDWEGEEAIDLLVISPGGKKYRFSIPARPKPAP